MRDESSSREPTVLYKPEETQTYYVAVQAADLDGNAENAGVALAPIAKGLRPCYWQERKKLTKRHQGLQMRLFCVANTSI